MIDNALDTGSSIVSSLKAQAGGRPISLDEVASSWPATIGDSKAEWLDLFHAANQEQRGYMLNIVPHTLPDKKWNAYLGALAEYMASWASLPIPAWTEAAERFLHRAWFPSGLESLKAYCLLHSPTEFRRRMIFIGESPTTRARYGLPDLLPGQDMSWLEFNQTREVHGNSKVV